MCGELAQGLVLQQGGHIETLIFLNILFIYLYIGEGREKEEEKHQCVVASYEPHTGNLACNPGMCPDWELNW